MATSKSGNGKRTTAKAKLEALQYDNDQLRETVERLKAINAEQLKRLVGTELLRSHVAELEQRLNRKIDD